MVNAFDVVGTVFAVSINLIAAVGYLSFLLIHYRNVYLDLYTTSRLSVSHRRRAPEITNDYKIVAYCTCLMGLFGCMNAVGVSVRPFLLAYGQSSNVCAILSVFGMGGILSKLFVYLVFTVRYQMVYGGSQYAIRKERLKFVYAFLIGFGGLIFVWGVMQWSFVFANDNPQADFTQQEWDLTYDYDTIYEYKCNMTPSTGWILSYSVFDIIINVGFCYKFIKPIWQVIRLVQGSSRNVTEKSKLEKKMLFVGFKVFILSAALFLSTIFLGLLYFGASLFVIPVDLCINFICLALMTPYYPDSKYYQKLCACCIFCCDRKGYTKRAELNDEKSSGNGDIAIGAQSPGDDNDNDREAREVTEEQTVFSSVSDPNQSGSAQTQTHAVSVDTMSAVRIATNEEASPMTLDGNNTRDQTSAEVELAQNLNDQRETQ